MLKLPALIVTAPPLVTTKFPEPMSIEPPVMVAADILIAALIVPAVIFPASRLAITVLPMVLDDQAEPVHSH